MAPSTRRGGRKTAKPAPRTRDVIVAALAGCGLLLSAYLLAVRLLDTKSFCLTGKACDLVQTSAYATVAGVPVTVLGLAFYGSVLAVALPPRTNPARWRALMPLAAAGVSASVIFTFVQQVILLATCSTCLLSAVLCVAILAAAWRRRPFPAAPVAWTTSGAALVAVLVLGGAYAITANEPPPAADDPQAVYALALAGHLKATGAQFYGAYWCSHCAEQKKLFGRAASALPYVECDARTPGGRPDLCQAAGVNAFPTWVIAGRNTEGVMTLEALASRSGYRRAP
ncbi:MAG: vitamin K epoxide reductase family protein [Armatimonadetes bacterium]|nr:vitamin K epoxide reductase family protein [Armatimonadota bacterium]